MKLKNTSFTKLVQEQLTIQNLILHQMQQNGRWFIPYKELQIQHPNFAGGSFTTMIVNGVDQILCQKTNYKQHH